MAEYFIWDNEDEQTIYKMGHKYIVIRKQDEKSGHFRFTFDSLTSF